MGSYLDKPETTKISALDENDLMLVGSSSMQGWRINQEDAHNAILDFANNSAFFAVFDGHGGAEVAQYCSMKLPEFLKNLASFKGGNYSQALVEAFLGFDATLLDEKVLGELKALSEEYDEDEDEHEEVFNLHKEANMSLKDVLENYKRNNKANKEKVPNEVDVPAGSSSSSSTTAEKKTDEKSAELEVSSSSKTSSSREQSDMPSSSSGGSGGSSSSAAPDSTQKIIPESSSQDNKVETTNKSDADNTISSSSSSTQENGEVAEAPSSSSSSSMPKPADSAAGGSSAGGSSQQPADSGAGGSSSSVAGASPVKENAPSASVPKPSGGSSSETDSEDALDSEEGSDDKDEDMFDEEDDEDEEDSDEDGEEDTSDDDEEQEEDDLLNNEFMQKMENGPGKASGCTAVVALLVGREVIVANAGDSRCIICRNGKPIEMSFDHKPEDEIEFDRIKKAGGRVSLDGRVNGGLNLSRAIGDHGYKLNKELRPEEQMISAEPDLKKHILEPGDEFMVLACDGIWNYMSNEEVVLFVKQRIDGGKKTLSEICEELFNNCLAPNTLGDGTGCDNMTAIIVKFKPEIFELPATSSPDTNEAAQNTQAKRSLTDDDNEVSEAIAAAPQKKLKIDDDLTPAAVDTSTS